MRPLDMRLVAIILLASIMPLCAALRLNADYSSLTADELRKIKTALDMAAEYKALLAGHEVRKIESIDKVGDSYRIRLLLSVHVDGLPVRDIRRDIMIQVSAESPVVWPWYIASGAVGLILGMLVTK